MSKQKEPDKVGMDLEAANEVVVEEEPVDNPAPCKKVEGRTMTQSGDSSDECNSCILFMA